MKREIVSGKLDNVLREVDENIRVVVWFWIGTHQEHNNSIQHLR